MTIRGQLGADPCSNATDSQSLLASMHYLLHPDFQTRPADASQPLRLLSYFLGGLMTIATFWAAGRRQPTGPSVPLLFGGLIVVMLLLCPICHLHYFSMAIPLVMGILAAKWGSATSPRYGAGLIALLLVNGAVTALPNLPGMEGGSRRGDLRCTGLSCFGLSYGTGGALQTTTRPVSPYAASWPETTRAAA